MEVTDDGLVMGATNLQIRSLHGFLVFGLIAVLFALGASAQNTCQDLRAQLNDLIAQKTEAQRSLNDSSCAGAAKAGCLQIVVGLNKQIAAVQKLIDSGNCPSDTPPPPVRVPCPSQMPVIDIRSNDQRQQLIDALAAGNATIRLGPDIDMSFGDLPNSAMPLVVGRCTTLTSVAAFLEVPPLPHSDSVLTRQIDGTAPDVAAGTAGRRSVPRGVLARNLFGSARTPHSRGPVLRYGVARSPSTAFLHVGCYGFGIDGIHISGFRLFGPTFATQYTTEVGINIDNCHDVEVSNMEIAGWGQAAIQVLNSAEGISPPRDHAILIHDNFIHDNKHPSRDGNAEGYGVNAGVGGWITIYQNTFDNNRHSVTANGHSGGYTAERNLVLKGGGYHNGTFATISYEKYIHVFDVHGTDNCDTLSHSAWNCGEAGNTFVINDNTFQYTKTTDIHLRGKPVNHATIAGNVFARSDYNAAIDLQTDQNVTVDTNQYDVDGFGQYAVCDFDGDGIDDLFLATGVTWWFSSFGELNWSYLNAKPDTLSNLRFGYFDGDQKCDVLAEHPSGSGNWFISSGGTSDWKPLGSFGHPLSEVHFGRFDPAVTDDTPGATRQTTHAFWRRSDGAWLVTALSSPEWHVIGSSSFPLDQLKFGDFTGHGRTHVLAVENGHWAISEGGSKPWRMLNPTLKDPVGNLVIANMDADDNIDDILRLDRQVSHYAGKEHVTMTWWRSKNGTEPWKVWKKYEFDYPLDAEHWTVKYGFSGRFGAAPGGGTMVIDDSRVGHFFSAAEAAVGAAPEWFSVFPY
ncbi:MAG: hypothetical protein QOI88_2719 [Gammaproteobacteria bacterium]|nr:hypothetical protein [Gammaproteobacteria bacterium]